MMKRLRGKGKFLFPIGVALILGAAIGVVAASSVSDDFYREIPLFTDTLSLVQSDYVDELEVKDMIYGALKGMLSSLDPHSQFMDPDTYREMQIETKGEFGGLGIVITIREQFLTVVTPIEDTPAYRAGLKSGDRIVKIDDKPTKDFTLFEAVKGMRGKPGTDVHLTVLRENVNHLLEFTVTRDVIEIQSVKEARILEASIGYIKLVEFQEKTKEEMAEALEKLDKEGMKSLILDLRNNPGGLLNSSVDVTEFFIPQGELVVSTKGRMKSQSMEFKAKGKKTYQDLPMVVLINEGSASAAEIVAGAIRDHQRGILLGAKSFGKGSVQTVSPLRDGSAVRLTTAKYYTPSGQTIHETGIEPDVKVEVTAEERSKIAERKVEVIDEVDVVEEEKGEEEEKGGQGKEKEGQEKVEAVKEVYDTQLARAVDLIKGIQVWQRFSDHARN
jgi:carboxyl-terminal processing protease